MKYLLLSLCFLIVLGCKPVDEKKPDTSNSEITTEENKVSEESSVSDTKPSNGPFAHNIYVWLKNPESKEDREAFINSMNRFLDASEYIISSHVGLAVPSERAVVDDSFTFAVLLTFKSKEDEALYQEEAAHKQFIAETSQLWEKIKIYDSIDILE